MRSHAADPVSGSSRRRFARTRSARLFQFQGSRDSRLRFKDFSESWSRTEDRDGIGVSACSRNFSHRCRLCMVVIFCEHSLLPRSRDAPAQTELLPTRPSSALSSSLPPHLIELVSAAHNSRAHRSSRNADTPTRSPVLRAKPLLGIVFVQAGPGSSTPDPSCSFVYSMNRCTRGSVGSFRHATP
jgi:hypothetical protein